MGVLKIWGPNMEVSKNWRPLFGSPYNRDHSILGSILGPLFMATLI